MIATLERPVSPALKITGAELIDMCNRTLKTVGKENDIPRRRIDGILFTTIGGALAAVSTDAKRMTICRISCDGAENYDKNVLVPAQIIKAVKTAVKPDSIVYVRFTDGESGKTGIAFDVVSLAKNAEERLTLSTPGIDGVFPGWKTVIPTRDKITASFTCSKNSIKTAVGFLSAYCSKRDFDVVQFYAENGSVKISCNKCPGAAQLASFGGSSAPLMKVQYRFLADLADVLPKDAAVSFYFCGNRLLADCDGYSLAVVAMQ